MWFRPTIFSNVGYSEPFPWDMRPGQHSPSSRSESIFCDNALLDALQTSPFRPFKDSKTLVDLSLRHPPNIVLARFDHLPKPLSELDYRNFLAFAFSDNPDCIHRESRQNESPIVIAHTPSDYTTTPPSFITSSTSHLSFSPSLVSFVTDLKSRWLKLCHRHDPSFFADPDTAARTSLLPLPQPFFVPGGRFRECYYWDTLWIIKGLLASDMVASAQNAVRNLVFLVDKYGFVPNGSRTYYLTRTQPPILTEAVRLVHNALPPSQRIPWLHEVIPALDKELQFFHTHRAISTVLPGSPISSHTLSVYAAQSTGPRPESYMEDVQTAADGFVPADTASVYRNISTAAESGWDFSSRWYSEQSVNQKESVTGNPLAHMKICNIVPVCLNSLLLHAERTVAGFHRVLGNVQESAECDNRHSGSLDRSECEDVLKENPHALGAKELSRIASRREKDMTTILWDPTRAFWFDFDAMENRKTCVVSCAGIMPIWAGCNSTNWTCEEAQRFVRFVTVESGLLGPGGLAATTQRTEQQWDFPNCWPPLVDLAVDALENLATFFPDCGASKAAADIAKRFVYSAFRAWQSHGVMHEKYDSTSTQGERGAGGEYEPQTGFGWTNGTVLWMLRHFIEKDETFWSDLC